MEGALGHDFSRVQVHSDRTAANTASSLRARAFTLGDHIAFADGAFRPGEIAGDALLAHELAHVAQQRDVSPSARPELGQDHALEGDADVAAVNAVGSLWGGWSGMARGPRRSGAGLRLQRCDDGFDPEKDPARMDQAYGKSKRLEKWLGPKSGRQPIAPRLEPLEDDAFASEFNAYRGRIAAQPGAAGEAARQDTSSPSEIAGFRDRKRKKPVVLAQSRANIGYANHEGLHENANPDFEELGFNISEGFTEFFAQVVVQDAGLPPSNESKYRNAQLPPVLALFKLIGEDMDTFGNAYFNGQVGALKAKVDAAAAAAAPSKGAAKGTASTFDQWVSLMNQNRFKSAIQILPGHEKWGLDGCGVSDGPGM